MWQISRNKDITWWSGVPVQHLITEIVIECHWSFAIITFRLTVCVLRFIFRVFALRRIRNGKMHTYNSLNSISLLSADRAFNLSLILFCVCLCVNHIGANVPLVHNIWIMSFNLSMLLLPLPLMLVETTGYLRRVNDGHAFNCAFGSTRMALINKPMCNMDSMSERQRDWGVQVGNCTCALFCSLFITKTLWFWNRVTDFFLHW